MSELVLPMNRDAERLVLGLMLYCPEVMQDARPALSLDLFATDSHRRIAKHACSLYDAGQTVSAVTIATAMRDAGDLEAVGGLSYLLTLDEGLPQLRDVTPYVRLLAEDATRRRLMIAMDGLMRRAANGEGSEALREALVNVSADLVAKETGKGLVSARELVDRVGVSEILAPRLTRGVQFPWEWMNRWTCGMLPGELWVLAAHTSAGKTSAAIQTAVGVARAQSKGVAIFSLEMGDVPVFQRAVWQASRVDSERAKRGKLTAEERKRAAATVSELYELPLYFDDSSYSVMEIHARLRRLRSRGPLGLVIVDYLQLLRDGGRHNSRAEAVGANARALKLMAGEFQCPVLLLSQFNRESAKAKGNEAPRRPELYDLKESGDIENHANGVWFIHRPSPEDADVIPVEFILPKQRDGRRNILQDFWFFPNHQRFDAKQSPEESDGE